MKQVLDGYGEAKHFSSELVCGKAVIRLPKASDIRLMVYILNKHNYREYHMYWCEYIIYVYYQHVTSRGDRENKKVLRNTQGILNE